MQTSTLSIPTSQLGTRQSLQAILAADQVEIVPDASATEQHVLQACRDALQAEHDYATKAVIAGMLLNEFRHHLARTSHTEKSSLISPISPISPTTIHGRNQHSKGDSFLPWIESHGIAKPTAYRWMTAAERVARHQLNLPQAAPFTPFIEIHGEPVPLSKALLAPTPSDGPAGSQLDPRLASFRQSFFDFMQDKTLAEATRAAVDGESPAHRITRAAAGKATGGTKGEDRKAWHTFIAEKLSDISAHLKHWRSFTGPQKECTQEALHRAVEKWPTPVLEHMAKAIKLELTRR